mmetsp:Transcript_112277/g.312433  ORF Transcript_112277/g.312433 Transcript_112277/m.312433 type:complete len:117 (-) Transcript_112277:270-620(-)
MGNTPCCTPGDDTSEPVVVRTLKPAFGAPSHEIILRFRLPDGVEKDCTFTRKPLGFDFEKNMPIVVKRVKEGGNAEELGVQPGWIVLAVGDQDIADLDFMAALGRLRERSNSLPTI